MASEQIQTQLNADAKRIVTEKLRVAAGQLFAGIDRNDPLQALTKPVFLQSIMMQDAEADDAGGQLVQASMITPSRSYRTRNRRSPFSHLIVRSTTQRTLPSPKRAAAKRAPAKKTAKKAAKRAPAKTAPRRADGRRHEDESQ